MKRHLLKKLTSLFLILSLSFCFSHTAAAASGAQNTQSKTEALDSLFTTVELLDADISALLAAMEQGRVTSEKLVQQYLDRIEAYDKALALNSIININPNALEDAKAADRARSAGETGKLLGIPIIVKDNLDVAGMATTCGDKKLKNNIAKTDSAVVSLLKQEGAVILAKANMDMYANSGAHSRSTIAETVHNAYDLSRTPAGSSGGSAVAATCCFAAAALGSDTGSSIRRPASFANLYGLRTSYGSVNTSGLFYMIKKMDTIGPMCRTAEDAAILLEVMTNGTVPSSAAIGTTDLSGFTIGYLENSFGYGCHYSYEDGISFQSGLNTRVIKMTENALRTLEDCGAHIVDISHILTSNMIADLYCGTQSRELVTKLLEKNGIDAVVYLSQNDLPMLEQTSSNAKNNSYGYIGRFGPKCGLPDLMLPMGLSETDSDAGFDHALPLGLSIFSGYGKDIVLLQIACAYENAGNFRESPPTTPALPDKQLELFSKELLKETDQLNRNAYTEKSFAELEEAVAALKSIRMKTVEEITAEILQNGTLSADAEGIRPVSTEEYLEAVRAVAQAFDNLKPMTKALYYLEKFKLFSR